MASENGYPMKEPKLSGGGAKDQAAYSEKVGQGGGAARKGAPLDAKGQTGKKDEAPYKEACKDQ